MGVVSMPRSRAFIVMALAGSALCVSAYLTFVHYRLRADIGWESACSINATLDCDRVVLSEYGTVAGAPLAAFAMWFYLLTMVVAALRRKPE